MERKLNPEVSFLEKNFFNPEAELIRALQNLWENKPELKTQTQELINWSIKIDWKLEQIMYIVNDPSLFWELYFKLPEKQINSIVSATRWEEFKKLLKVYNEKTRQFLFLHETEESINFEGVADTILEINNFVNWILKY